jgi:TrmH family RNA methyltransferase
VERSSTTPEGLRPHDPGERLRCCCEVGVLVISSLSNPRIKHLRELMSKGQVDSENRIPVEGLKLIREALQSGLAVGEVYVCASKAQEKPLQEVLNRTERLGIKRQFVADRVYNAVVDTEASQGIVALVKLPRFQLSDVTGNSPFLFLAHQLQDPGNLGTLIRSAEAFGVRAVLLTEKTVSPVNQKAVRASAGSLFRMPVLAGFNPHRLLDDLRQHGFKLVAATAQGGEDFRKVDYRGPTALVVGNEGSGLPKSALQQIHLRVTIPLSVNVESLNVAVASSIILSEAARQRWRSAVVVQ